MQFIQKHENQETKCNVTIHKQKNRLHVR